MTRLLSLAVVLLAWGALCAAAHGQTLQLPQFQFSTVNTTVSVPDQGEVLLGGVKRASEGQVSRGVPVLGKLPGAGRLFNNRGIGSERSTGMMSARAYIIDHAEMDEAILAEGARRLAQRQGEGGAVLADQGPWDQRVLEQRALERAIVDDRADFLSRNIARHQPAREAPAAPAGPSPEQIRAQQQQLADAQQQEALELYEKARSAAANGKLRVSKLFLDMAAKRATGDLKQHVLAQMPVVTAALADGGATANR